MGLAGPDFYDDEDVFSTYMAHHDRSDSPNDILEKPVLMELLGDLSGKRILDLGCGDAAFASEAFRMGCVSYLGIEGSRNMLALATQNLSGSRGESSKLILRPGNLPRKYSTWLSHAWFFTILPVWRRSYSVCTGR